MLVSKQLITWLIQLFQVAFLWGGSVTGLGIEDCLLVEIYCLHLYLAEQNIVLLCLSQQHDVQTITSDMKKLSTIWKTSYEKFLQIKLFKPWYLPGCWQFLWSLRRYFSHFVYSNIVIAHYLYLVTKFRLKNWTCLLEWKIQSAVMKYFYFSLICLQ